MKAMEISRRGVHNPNPVITFNINIENDNAENTIVITNIASTVLTAPPMRRLYLGRLVPCDAFMSINGGDSRSFPFDLDLGWKGLYYLEDARQNQPSYVEAETKDVWLDIHMKIAFLEVTDMAPIKFRWDGFHVGKEVHDDKIRIPQSDWLKLRTELGYRKMRIIEVTKETYELVEKYMEKTKIRNVEDAIRNSILESLAQARAQGA